MAYENYYFVSWTNGTPITGERLAQMSTNIEQVKDAVDDKTFGIVRLNEVTTNSNTFTDFAEKEIIFLRDDTGTGGADRRVSIDANRYYKVTVNIPSISVLGPGAEDSKYVINVYNGANIADTNKIKLAYWEISTPTFTHINVASNANNNTISLMSNVTLTRANISNVSVVTNVSPVSNTIANVVVKTTTYPTKIGAGTYTVVKTTSNAITNQSFFMTVTRSVGSNPNNAPSWRVDATTDSPIQIYVEDAGGV